MGDPPLIGYECYACADRLPRLKEPHAVDSVILEYSPGAGDKSLHQSYEDLERGLVVGNVALFFPCFPGVTPRLYAHVGDNKLHWHPEFRPHSSMRR